MFGHLPHYLRRRLDRKYVIIESDDWGLERARDEGSIEWARSKFGEENFTRWTLDSLETSEDMELLFQVLRRHRDSSGRKPAVTANFITHNIDLSSTGSLRFIPISRGFNQNTNVANCYATGMAEGIFRPQLHGFSHYNMETLNEYFETEEGAEAMRSGFPACRSTMRGNLAFLQGELSSQNPEARLLTYAASEFEVMFGYKSKSLIPPTFILDMNLIETIRECGIRLIQSSNRLVDSGKKRYSFAYLRNRQGIIWSVRNARLDPVKGYDFYHEQCLDAIDAAFRNKLPAVIDIHRVNFSGRFAPDYRNRTLNELDELLSKLISKHPDLFFICTDELIELIWQQRTR